MIPFRIIGAATFFRSWRRRNRWSGGAAARDRIRIASGVTPAQGLWTAIIAGFFISLLGGSKVQIGGPTGAFVPILAGVVARLGYDGLALATFRKVFLRCDLQRNYSGRPRFGAAIAHSVN